jgi:hypothetical protein
MWRRKKKGSTLTRTIAKYNLRSPFKSQGGDATMQTVRSIKMKE